MLPFLVLLSSASAATAAVISERVNIIPRVQQPSQPLINDACFNPVNRMDGESVFDCPRKVEVKEDGTCPMHWNEEDLPRCAGYCEVRLSYSYGREQPFDTSRCGQGDCGLSAETSATVTKSFSFTLGIESQAGLAVSLGATWGWSESKGTTTGLSREKPDKNKDNCGYWTFVPYYVSSCGTLTHGDLKTRSVGGPRNSCENVVTTHNVCTTSLWKNKDGNIGGVPIFVATECKTQKPLPFCKQDPIFLKQGVAQDASVYNEFLEAHFDNDPSKDILGTALAMCDQGKWPPGFNETGQVY
ncbi:uncharacterized protein BP5553_04002 [Venustampulla echinocandica]|uniref:Uncharacterized protein n=1 Tax=Venustampulla echinocandica TaxID=2656787 RepID=A0A370TVV9_9HELO|nr:uncharacterized protein BP5553_04002 [Venustampulla echinocandica]RDL39662.1 hypothetical protein BP5553_04002 [Venustampulla echinocandica]